MSVEKKQRRKHRRTTFGYLRQFGYEIAIIALLIIGGFLIVEKTDVSAVLTNWIKNSFNYIVGGLANFARNGFDFFAAFETSDIVGYLLILLAIHLMIMRGRKRLFREYGSIYKCPYCEHEKMQRVKRHFWHKLIGILLVLRIKYYQCKACNKGTVSFSKLK